MTRERARLTEKKTQEGLLKIRWSI